MEQTIEDGRFVGWFDVLGYKALCKDLPLEEQKELFGGGFVRQAEFASTNGWRMGEHGPEPIQGMETNHLYRFTDTLVFISHDKTAFGLVDLIQATRNAVNFYMQQGIPLRGAITYGEVFVEEPAIFLGEGFVRAAELEARQQWVGGVVDPELETRWEADPATDRLDIGIWDKVGPGIWLAEQPLNRVFKEGAAEKLKLPDTIDQVTCLRWPTGMTERKQILANLERVQEVEHHARSMLERAVAFHKDIVD